MNGSIFGRHLQIATFGESHGPGVGVVIDGLPAGFKIDLNKLSAFVAKRKPGQSKITTQRKEGDEFEILSGVFEGKTLGTPVAILIRNQDQRSGDYSHIAESYRPSHADFTYQMKFGHRDYRGGGRSSARETAARVVAGGLAMQMLEDLGIVLRAGVVQVSDIRVDKIIWKEVNSNIVRAPNNAIAKKMEKYIEGIRKKGESCGGVIRCEIENLPVGLGEPVFDRFEADLAKAMLSINATKGFEIGSGFAGTCLLGSEHNDLFVKNKNGRIVTKTNHSGGVQGGITNGMPVTFNVAFKPVATIMKDQDSIDKSGKKAVVKGKGRHDPCVLPRAVPIVEAMAALVTLDHFLRNQTSKWDDLCE